MTDDVEPQQEHRHVDCITSQMNDVFLSDTWAAYAHHPSDGNWTHASYRLLGIISSVSDFWDMWNSASPFVDRTMLFVMREHVFPAWDDPECIEGCIASVTVPLQHAAASFQEVLQRVLGHCLLTADAADHWHVNGASIGPKNGFCVIKIWFKAQDVSPDSVRVSHAASCARITPCRDQIKRCRYT